MEHANWFVNSEKLANTTDLQIEDVEGSLQCTYFRQPTQKSLTKDKANDLIVTNVSDTSTDSDDESNDEVAVTQDGITNGTSCMNNKNSDFLKKSIKSPTVTFNQTLFIESPAMKRSYLRKRPIKKIIERVPMESAQLRKKKMTIQEKKKLRHQNVDLKMTNTYQRLRLKKNVVFNDYAKLLLTENSGFFTGPTDNTLYAISATQYNLPRRFQQLVKNGSSKERISKKRKLVENKIAGNKRLLETVKQLIGTMNETGQNIVFRSNLESWQDNELKGKVEDIDSNDIKKQKDKKREYTDKLNDKGIETKRPFFQKPETEKFLDETMERAMRKYKTRTDTWLKLKKSTPTSQDISRKKKSISWLSM